MFGYRVTLSYDNTFHNEQEAVFCDTMEQVQTEALKMLRKSVAFMKLNIDLDLESSLSFYEKSLLSYCNTFLETGVSQYSFKSAIIKIDMRTASRPGYLLKVYEQNVLKYECCYKGVNGKRFASRDFKQYCEHLTNVFNLNALDRVECLEFIDQSRKLFKSENKTCSLTIGDKLIVLKKAE